MELQRDSHIKQQRLIQERLKREARREATKVRSGLLRASSGPSPLSQTRSPGKVQSHGFAGPSECGGAKEREYDTLLYQLQTRQTGAGHPLTARLTGCKTTKDDKTRLEEQQTTIEDLRRLVDHLMNDNERLKAENAQLRSEAADFVERSELWVLPPTGGGHERKNTGKKGKEIAIPQLPPLEMPAQEDLCLDDLPPLELPEDIQNELQELLDRDKL